MEDCLPCPLGFFCPDPEKSGVPNILGLPCEAGYECPLGKLLTFNMVRDPHNGSSGTSRVTQVAISSTRGSSKKTFWEKTQHMKLNASFSEREISDDVEEWYVYCCLSYCQNPANSIFILTMDGPQEMKG